jgi:hypothetical protein
MLNRRNLILFVVSLILVAAPILAAGGTVNYSISKPMFVAGTEIPAGEYEVKWQAADSDAKVVFKSKGNVVATVQGKMEQLKKKSDYNSLTVGKDAAGHDAIKGLLFSGKDVTVVFP